MKILFEGMGYESGKLSSVLPKNNFCKHQDTEFTSFVGYFYSREINEPVFILPKVFVNDGEKFLGDCYYKDLYNLDPNRPRKYLGKRYDHFLFDLSIRVYRTIRKYEKRTTLTSVDYNTLPIVYNNNCHNKQSSLLELYTGIIDFYQRNKYIFTFTSKTSHSGKKIKWHRTIASEKPIIVDNTPIYILPVSSVKSINYEEELIIILYSVLEYFKTQYGLKINFEFNYPILKRHEFMQLLNGKGVRILKKIKHKYYRDVFLRLWDLLYAFFDLNKKINMSGAYEESLLCSDFQLVFEDMIDDLIGDKDLPEDIRYFKDQKDGKVVDHLFQGKDILNDKEIFYIADSKYYKQGTAITGTPLEKQFTYAKNIIQYSINALLEGKERRNMRYRDNVTEGYNVTPNFFIQGVVMDKAAGQSSLRLKEQTWLKEIQFENRLFDRDTLMVLTFEIDFMFVMSMYISENRTKKDQFKRAAKTAFRQNFINMLKSRYSFYAIAFETMDHMKDLVRLCFKDLNGKIYRTDRSEFIVSGCQCLFLALEKSEKFKGENERLLGMLYDSNILDIYEVELNDEMPSLINL